MAAIKKTILLALVALLMAGCEEEPKVIKHVNGFDVVVVDSCEYVFRTEGYKGFLAHKGNCRFCKERRQKELEELIIKLKEK